MGSDVHWPMHEIKINIISTEILECLVQSRFNIFRCVLGVPKFASDENVLSRHSGPPDTFADLGFVAVDGCAINVSVPFLQSNFNCSLDLMRSSLPGSKANGWDFGAGVELEMSGKFRGVRHGEQLQE